MTEQGLVSKKETPKPEKQSENPDSQYLDGYGGENLKLSSSKCFILVFHQPSFGRTKQIVRGGGKAVLCLDPVGLVPKRS